MGELANVGRDQTKPASPCPLVIEGLHDLRSDCVLLVSGQGLDTAQSFFEKTPRDSIVTRRPNAGHIGLTGVMRQLTERVCFRVPRDPPEGGSYHSGT